MSVIGKLQKLTRNNFPGVIVGIVFILLTPTQVMADEGSSPEPRKPNIENEPPLSTAAINAREDINRILEGPDFNRQATKKTWRFKNREELEKDEEIPDWFIRFIEFLEKYFGDSDGADKSNSRELAKLFAQLIEFLLWVVGISVVILIVYHYRDYLKDLIREVGKQKAEERVAPTVLFGLDVTPQSLPENVPEQVTRLWQAGEYREALGLLYRATLSCLMNQYEFQFSESATETECATIVEQSAQSTELKGYMNGLTRLWQRLAYGHRKPADDAINSLCDRWPELFSHGR